MKKYRARHYSILIILYMIDYNSTSYSIVYEASQEPTPEPPTPPVAWLHKFILSPGWQPCRPEVFVYGFRF